MSNDPYWLVRFVEAQEGVYQQALSELRDGRKQSHWMWYVFPQFAGLGTSAASVYYSIRSIEEAAEYLRHPVLGPRLQECAGVLLAINGRTASEIFGSPDDIKLNSCATLFAHVSPAGSSFERILDKYYQGERDTNTLQLLERKAE